MTGFIVVLVVLVVLVVAVGYVIGSQERDVDNEPLTDAQFSIWLSQKRQAQCN